MNPFRQVLFVLVEPKYEGNIGAAARVIKNLGFSRLALVNPRAEIGDEARKLAYQSQDILEKAPVFRSLSEAVAEAGLVIGTTRRKGIMRGFQISPPEMAEMAALPARENLVALVFGPEDRGLSTPELALCHWVVKIPSKAKFDSFNLAQAVAIIGYELAKALQGPAVPRLATARSLEVMFRRMEELLKDIDFLREADPTRMMVKVRRVFFRSGLDENEIKILQGIISQVKKKIGKKRKSGK